MAKTNPTAANSGAKTAATSAAKVSADSPTDPAMAVTPPAALPLPSELFRTVASLLIFIHLFCVGLAVTTDTDSGACQLLQKIKTNTPLVDSYLTQLWLDHGYDYHLMNDDPQGLDWDHQVKATINFADGATETVMIPPADLGPGDRRARHQRLAWWVGLYVDRATSDNATTSDNERKLLVPASIGGALLRQRADKGAKSVEISCEFHRGISRDEMQSKTPGESDPMNARYFQSLPASSGPTPPPFSVLVSLDSKGEAVAFEPLPSAETSPVLKSGQSKGTKTSATGSRASSKASPQ